MELQKYIFSVAAAGIVCGVITTLAGSKSAAGSLIKMLAGIFLAVTVVRPAVNLDLGNVEDYLSGIMITGEDIAASGKMSSQESAAAIIKERLEAYILDKAAELNASLSVEVTVGTGEVPAPEEIILTGRISPDGKRRLSRIITDDLGIAKENQMWIG